MIPLGGYVQMKGQDDSKPTLVETGDDSYNTKNLGKKNYHIICRSICKLYFSSYFYTFSIALMGAKL